MSIKVFDRTFEALSKSLDLRAQKQVVISSNIANADTPGYQAKTLDFEDALSKALTVDRSLPELMVPGGRVEDVRGEIYNQINNVVREDGNNVDREAEMSQLAENQILYNAAADLVRKKLAMIRYSIADGGAQ